jgi:ABC-type antimicrobial peptide transport system permease subunit
MLRRLGILAISAATSITLLLSVSGIYALMSFIVAQRTREIGIRSALGAEQRKIVLQIFSRALLQLGGGVAVGVAVLGVFSIELTELRSLKLLVPIAAAIVSMGLVACAVPTWRALKVQPTEALREGGT